MALNGRDVHFYFEYVVTLYRFPPFLKIGGNTYNDSQTTSVWFYDSGPHDCHFDLDAPKGPASAYISARRLPSSNWDSLRLRRSISDPNPNPFSTKTNNNYHEAIDSPSLSHFRGRGL